MALEYLLVLRGEKRVEALTDLLLDSLQFEKLGGTLDPDCNREPGLIEMRVGEPEVRILIFFFNVVLFVVIVTSSSTPSIVNKPSLHIFLSRFQLFLSDLRKRLVRGDNWLALSNFSFLLENLIMVSKFCVICLGEKLSVCFLRPSSPPFSPKI